MGALHNKQNFNIMYHTVFCSRLLFFHLMTDSFILITGLDRSKLVTYRCGRTMYAVFIYLCVWSWHLKKISFRCTKIVLLSRCVHAWVLSIFNCMLTIFISLAAIFYLFQIRIKWAQLLWLEMTLSEKTSPQNFVINPSYNRIPIYKI